MINPKAVVYIKDISTAELTCPYREFPFDTREGFQTTLTG
jgi:hypothetical protein